MAQRRTTPAPAAVDRTTASVANSRSVCATASRSYSSPSSGSRFHSSETASSDASQEYWGSLTHPSAVIDPSGVNELSLLAGTETVEGDLLDGKSGRCVLPPTNRRILFRAESPESRIVVRPMTTFDRNDRDSLNTVIGTATSLTKKKIVNQTTQRLSAAGREPNIGPYLSSN